MKIFSNFFLLSVFFSPVVFAALPNGFSAAEVEKLMAGQIVVAEESNEGKIYKGVYKAYLDKVSCETYEKLVTDHAGLPKLFKEIKKAETLKSNDAKTEFEYLIKLRINEGPVTFFFEPIIAQVVNNPKDRNKECVITNLITNYKEDIEEGKITDRLIPYENGVLVEQRTSIQLKNEDKKTSKVKDHVVSYFKRLIPAFKGALKG